MLLAQQSGEAALESLDLVAALGEDPVTLSAQVVVCCLQPLVRVSELVEARAHHRKLRPGLLHLALKGEQCLLFSSSCSGRHGRALESLRMLLEFLRY